MGELDRRRTALKSLAPYFHGTANRNIKACKRLGLPHFHHHDFRPLFATTCLEAGVDLPTVARWLGHKDGGALAMRVYGHLRQEHSFRQIKLVNFGLESSPTKAGAKLGSSTPTGTS